MRPPPCNVRSAPHRAHLARAITLALGAAFAATGASAATEPVAIPSATTWTVTDCDDLPTSSYSLRAFVLIADSGDTIDLGNCGVIQMQSMLPIPQTNLRLVGGAHPPGAPTVVLDGHGALRPLQHLGTGTLTLEGIEVRNGRFTDGVARGGCISSLGHVTLRDSVLRNCVAERTGGSGDVRGGALFTAGDITLERSIVTSGFADNLGDGAARGGGLYSSGRMTISDGSQVYYNGVHAAAGAAAGGGVFIGSLPATISDSSFSDNGLYLERDSDVGEGGAIATGATSGDLSVLRSTITGNGIDGGDNRGGGIAALHANLVVADSFLTYNTAAVGGGIVSGATLTVEHSKVDRNQAHDFGGGIAALAGRVTITSSSVAGNYATDRGAGIATAPAVGAIALTNSTFAGNQADQAAGLDLRNDGSSIDIKQCSVLGNLALQYSGRPFRGAGIYLGNDAMILSSTIHLNTTYADWGGDSSAAPGAGLWIDSGITAILGSTLVSGNRRHGATAGEWLPSDLAGGTSALVFGDHNLVGDTTLAVPGDTILAVDPQLAGFADNGGGLLTVLPLPGSPALEHGAAYSFVTDQRGPGYPRVRGAAADIGAVEYDGDRIFYSGFEGW